MTVWEFAKKCMNDDEFRRGGIIKNERKYLDAVGFSYKVEDGIVSEAGDDLHKFYDALYTILLLDDKYAKKN